MIPTGIATQKAITSGIPASSGDGLRLRSGRRSTPPHSRGIPAQRGIRTSPPAVRVELARRGFGAGGPLRSPRGRAPATDRATREQQRGPGGPCGAAARAPWRARVPRGVVAERRAVSADRDPILDVVREAAGRAAGAGGAEEDRTGRRERAQRRAPLRRRRRDGRAAAPLRRHDRHLRRGRRAARPWWVDSGPTRSARSWGEAGWGGWSGPGTSASSAARSRSSSCTPSGLATRSRGPSRSRGASSRRRTSPPT